MPDVKSSDAVIPPLNHAEDADRSPNEGLPIRTEPAKVNRGRRAPSEGSGVVIGSGAAAGGTGGIQEDYDDDPVGGGGRIAMPVASPKKSK